MEIEYEIDDTSYDQLISGNKISITDRNKIGNVGDILLIRGKSFRIIDVWMGTNGFLRQKVYRIDGASSIKDYDDRMEMLFGIVYSHHWFYVHFVAITDTEYIDRPGDGHSEPPQASCIHPDVNG